MDKPHFNINAYAVKQLGEELVSDEITAIIELVKNAYDADASYANVVVDTNNFFSSSDLYFPKENNESNTPGYILVEDDGTGMTAQEIEKGWLTISFSFKRDMRRKGLLTPKKNRTPLGEKGLGRLSTQRLGSRLEMITCKDPTLLGTGENIEKNLEHHVAFDWSDFSEDKSLTAVPVYLANRKVKKTRKGTKLIISNLRDPQVWLGDGQDKLVAQISQMIFPFEEVRPFSVFLTINGKRFDLDTISSSLRDVALSRFSFTFDGEKQIVSLRGQIKFSRLKGVGRDSEDIYRQVIELDNGKSFFEYLINIDVNKFFIPDLEYLGTSGWFFSFEKNFELKSISGLAMEVEKEEEKEKEEIANPGGFHGDIDEFFYRGVNLESIENIYSRVADYKDFVKQQVGVRVYRDGFGIRPYGLDGDDWLGLAKGQTSGRSFYGLRPENVIGFVSLTAKDNSMLREKTDREGLVDTPHSRNFNLILQKIVEIINVTFNNLRRSYNEYKKEFEKQDDGFSSGIPIFEDIKEINVTAQNMELIVDTLEKGLDATQEAVGTIAKQATDISLLASEDGKHLFPVLSEANLKLLEAKQLVDQFRDLIGKWQRIEKKSISIDARIQILEDQLEQFSELAGLGLTAEALSHEIHTIADELAEKTKRITDKIHKQRASNGDLIAYTEGIHSAISGLRRQLSHLAPSLQYVREQKEKISILEFF